MNPNLESEVRELQEALNELKPELRINPMELEEECRRQPEKFEMVGDIAIRAKALSRKAKDELDFVEADIKSQIRRDPTKFGLDDNKKPTNDAVNEATTIHLDVQEAKRNYIEISKVSDAFSILVQAMEQRKAMIRDLVSLYVHKYYDNQNLIGEEKQLNDSFERDIAEERNREIVEEG